MSSRRKYKNKLCPVCGKWCSRVHDKVAIDIDGGEGTEPIRLNVDLGKPICVKCAKDEYTEMVRVLQTGGVGAFKQKYGDFVI